MVIKKFRPFVRGLCISVSAMLCASTMVPASFAAEVQPQAGTQVAVEDDGLEVGVAPDIQAAPSTEATQPQAEPETQPQTKAETDPVANDGINVESAGEANEGGGETTGNGAGTGNETLGDDGITITDEVTDEPSSDPTQDSSETDTSEPDTQEEAIRFSKDVENPTADDTVNVTTRIRIDEAQTEAQDITLTLDGNANVGALTWEGLNGASVQIVHSGGTETRTLDGNVDLSGLAGITTITITPAAALQAGEVALTLALKPADPAITSLNLTASVGAEGTAMSGSYMYTIANGETPGTGEGETEDESESETETEPGVDPGTIVDGVVFSRDIENPLSSNAVTVNAQIGIKEDQAVAQDISLTFDGNTNVGALTSPQLAGARMVVTYGGTTQVLTLGEATDLSVYAGITQVAITPAAPLKAGNVDLQFIMQAAAEETGSMTVRVSTGTEGAMTEGEYVVPLTFYVLGTPAIGHPGALVQFDSDLTVRMEGIYLNANKNVSELNYSMALPSFMELKTIQAPTVSAGSVDVYVTVNGERTLIGQNAAGSTINVNQYAEAVEFVIHVESNAVTGTGSGSVVLANNLRSNKVNYYGFQANESITTEDGSSVNKTSATVGATIANYRYVEPEPPQEGDRPTTGGNNTGGSTGGGSGTGGGTGTGTGTGNDTGSTDEPETEEPETEDPNAEREEEEALRREEAAEELRREEEEDRNTRRNLLLSRLEAIRSGVSGNASTTETESETDEETSETTDDTENEAVDPRLESNEARELFENMKLIAIEESMVENLRPEDKRLDPEGAEELYEKIGLIAIAENMVRDLVVEE